MTVAERARSWTAELVECARRFDAEHGGPRWLRALREAGRERLATGGLPLGRDEAWTYTNVRPLLGERFQAADMHAGTGLHAGAGHDADADGWRPLAAADRPMESAVSDYPQHAFTALNQAFAGSGSQRDRRCRRVALHSKSFIASVPIPKEGRCTLTPSAWSWRAGPAPRWSSGGNRRIGPAPRCTCPAPRCPCRPPRCPCRPPRCPCRPPRCTCRAPI